MECCFLEDSVLWPDGENNMFRIISVISILAMLLLMIIFRYAMKKKSGLRNLIRKLGFLELLIFVITSLSLFGLTVSGFYSSIILNNPMSGYLLLGHVSIGVVFVLSIVFLSVLWAEASNVKEYNSTASKSDEDGKSCSLKIFSSCKKFFFWSFLTSSLVATLAILLSMMPIFGTQGLDILYEIHRWFALCSILTFISFIFYR